MLVDSYAAILLKNSVRDLRGMLHGVGDAGESPFGRGLAQAAIARRLITPASNLTLRSRRPTS